ncbi:hypothetical protein [Geodermatophilus sp. URMC 65]
MSRKTRRRSRRGPVLVLVTLLLAAGGFGLWTRSGGTAPAAAGTTPAPTTASVPAPEPAPSEPAATEPGTPDDADPDDADPDGDGTAGEESGGTAPEVAVPSAPTAAPQDEEVAAPTPVTVSLTYSGYDPSASAVVAGGYAADVVEVDATCTLVLRRDGVELRGESLGTPSATSTDCGEVRVGGAALTSGTWEAVLSYTSETSVGQSPAGEVVVP